MSKILFMDEDNAFEVSMIESQGPWSNPLLAFRITDSEPFRRRTVYLTQKEVIELQRKLYLWLHRLENCAVCGHSLAGEEFAINTKGNPIHRTCAT